MQIERELKKKYEGKRVTNDPYGSSVRYRDLDWTCNGSAFSSGSCLLTAGQRPFCVIDGCEYELQTMAGFDTDSDGKITGLYATALVLGNMGFAEIDASDGWQPADFAIACQFLNWVVGSKV